MTCNHSKKSLVGFYIDEDGERVNFKRPLDDDCYYTEEDIEIEVEDFQAEQEDERGVSIDSIKYDVICDDCKTVVELL